MFCGRCTLIYCLTNEVNIMNTNELNNNVAVNLHNILTTDGIRNYIRNIYIHLDVTENIKNVKSFYIRIGNDVPNFLYRIFYLIDVTL